MSIYKTDYSLKAPRLQFRKFWFLNHGILKYRWLFLDFLCSAVPQFWAYPQLFLPHSMIMMKILFDNNEQAWVLRSKQADGILQTLSTFRLKHGSCVRLYNNFEIMFPEAHLSATNISICWSVWSHVCGKGENALHKSVSYIKTTRLMINSASWFLTKQRTVSQADFALRNFRAPYFRRMKATFWYIRGFSPSIGVQSD